MFEVTEEKDRLRRQMSQEAINLAMQGRWKEAIAVNLSIIESMPTEVDAYNRLGKAYTELGDIEQAKEAYKKALGLSPKNVIALKNLNRLAQLRKPLTAVAEERPKAAPHIFIGDVGKAGVVYLHRIASNEVLARMTAGDQVYLKPQGHQLAVENEQEEYLGIVEPPHGFRLAKLMEGGNKYTAAIVSVDNDRIRIIIRETFQHPSQSTKLSFPAKTFEGFQPHVKDKYLRQAGGEEEEEEGFYEETEEGEYADLEEGELLPDGFSIFEENVSLEDISDEGLDEED
jgi:phosphopantetheinyl transferase (holo-ACP synthase)